MYKAWGGKADVSIEDKFLFRFRFIPKHSNDAKSFNNHTAYYLISNKSNNHIMAFRCRQHVALLAALISTSTAKESKIVPADLQAGFTTDTQVQVSYTGEAVNGFRDGTSFTKDG